MSVTNLFCAGVALPVGRMDTDTFIWIGAMAIGVAGLLVYGLLNDPNEGACLPVAALFFVWFVAGPLLLALIGVLLASRGLVGSD